MEDGPKRVGLEFDKNLIKSHPEIELSKAEKNSGVCSICYGEFEDPDYSAVSLPCGHQFCKECWVQYLKDKIKTNGPDSVFTRCP